MKPQIYHTNHYTSDNTLQVSAPHYTAGTATPGMLFSYTSSCQRCTSTASTDPPTASGSYWRKNSVRLSGTLSMKNHRVKFTLTYSTNRVEIFIKNSQISLAPPLSHSLLTIEYTSSVGKRLNASKATAVSSRHRYFIHLPNNMYTDDCLYEYVPACIWPPRCTCEN